MPRTVKLPASTTRPETSFYLRISTPSDPLASEVDAAYETALFVHPVFLDGYFFYPQFEDPALSSRYNLVAVDLVSHGQTLVHDGSIDGAAYDYDAIVGDLIAVMHALGVARYHFVGVAHGAMVGFHHAATHPERMLTYTCVAPSRNVDDADRLAGYVDCRQATIDCVNEQDRELCDMLTTATFEFGLGSAYTAAFRELKQGYIELYRGLAPIVKHVRQLSPPASLTAQIEYLANYMWNPLILRNKQEGHFWTIACPCLIFQSSGNDAEDNTDETIALVDAFNAVRGPGVPEGRTIVLPNAPHWMTLAYPDFMNPVLLEYFQCRTPMQVSLLDKPLPTPTIKTPTTPRFYGATPRDEGKRAA